MIKYKKYGYWYSNWDTYNIKASIQRKTQWWVKNATPLIYRLN